MGSKERRKREKEELREKILDAARDLLVKHGSEAVTMRKIAETIEYSATAIYQHFEDKDTLVRKLCTTDFAAAINDQAATISDPIERLRQSARAYVTFALQNPSQYRLLFMMPETHRDGKSADGNVEGAEHDAFGFIVKGVQAAIDAGLLGSKKHDAEYVAQMLWSVVHGVVSLHIAFGHEEELHFRPAGELANGLLDIVLRALANET